MEFQKHYTRDEARALLPEVKKWLKQLAKLRRQLAKYDERLAGMLSQRQDLGGDIVNAWVHVVAQMKTILMEFARREVQIKDLDRGLIDFPAFVEGKEVFLCWESGEPDIEFWHELETGYAGRQPLDEEDC